MWTLDVTTVRMQLVAQSGGVEEQTGTMWTIISILNVIQNFFIIPFIVCSEKLSTTIINEYFKKQDCTVYYWAIVM